MSLRTPAWIIIATLSLGACKGDDPTPAADTETGSTGDPPGTTQPMQTTVTDPTDPDSTTTSTSIDPSLDTSDTGTSSSDGGPVDSSSTGDDDGQTTTDDGGTDDDGGPVAEPWGDCINVPKSFCLDGDACLRDDPKNPGFGVCVTPGCETVVDCPAAPATGDAPVVCADVDADETVECALDCSAGQACPSGMTCFADNVCMHELVALPCADAVLSPPFPIVQSGSTSGQGDEFNPNCAFGNSADLAFQFTAPLTGAYVLHTQGTSFDSILVVYSGCGGPTIACNDDGPIPVDCGGYPCAHLVVDLQQNQTVLVVVDGYSAGAYSLTIDLLGDFGDCCDAHGTPGCEVPEAESCVCANDNFCCIVEWDSICVDIATSTCGVFCS